MLYQRPQYDKFYLVPQQAPRLLNQAGLHDLEQVLVVPGHMMQDMD